MRIGLLVLLVILISTGNHAQNVINGSVNGNVGNSQFGTVAGWEHCDDNEGFSNSADVCDIGFPSYNGNTTVTPIASPDGGTWAGIANDEVPLEDECIIGFMENLMIGNCYELFFYGANFGTGVGSYADGDSVILGVTIDGNETLVGIKRTAETWFEYRIPFIATAAMHSFRLHDKIVDGEGIGYCGLDGFDVFEVMGDISELEFDLGADTLLCNGAELELYVALDDVEFEWQDGSTDSNFVAQAAGVYWVEVFGQCGSFRDSIVIGVDAGPQQSLGNDTTLCIGETLILNSTLIDVDFEWQDGSENSSFEINEAGVYWLEVSNDCGGTRDSIIVSYEENLEVNIGNDQDLCDGDVLLIDVPLSEVIFEWQDGSEDSLISVAQGGIYWVEVTSNCQVLRDSIEINLIQEPEVELGEDQLLCGGETLLLEVESDGNSVLWSDGSTNNDLEIDQTGLVWVSLQNSCFDVRDSVYITVSDVPSVDLGDDLLLCHDEERVLQAQFPGASYLWHDGSEEFSFLVQDSGKISVIVSNECGEARDSILVDKYQCGCDYFVPNVFSPNIDGLNDEFMTFSNCPAIYYKLSVVNRWGALVFQSTDPDGRWFGYFNGDLAQTGVYSYFLEYQFEGEDKKLVSGDVTLLR